MVLAGSAHCKGEKNLFGLAEIKNTLQELEQHPSGLSASSQISGQGVPALPTLWGFSK